MNFAESRGDGDRDAQEISDLHGAAEKPGERHAAGVLQDQHGATAFAHHLERPHGPCTVQIVPQFIFVGEAIEACRRSVRGGRKDGQHSVPLAAGT